jgi:hypothetical protein
MLPPAPTEIRREMLILQILGANGYAVGSATVDFKVTISALEDSLLIFSVKAYEDSTRRNTDMSRTKSHNFSGNTVGGKMVAVFLS